MIVNSESAGTGRPTRISPLVINMLSASRRLPIVEMSAPSQFEPSLLRKIGSRPRVSSNRLRISGGVTDHPLLRTVAGEAAASVRPQTLEERVC